MKLCIEGKLRQMSTEYISTEVEFPGAGWRSRRNVGVITTLCSVTRTFTAEGRHLTWLPRTRVKVCTLPVFMLSPHARVGEHPQERRLIALVIAELGKLGEIVHILRAGCLCKSASGCSPHQVARVMSHVPVQHEDGPSMRENSRWGMASGLIKSRCCLQIWSCKMIDHQWF